MPSNERDPRKDPRPGDVVQTALEPTEADLAVADELDMLAAHIQEYIGPDDARDDIRRICRNRAEDLRRGVKRGPLAADVIAAAEKALETSVCYLRIYENENKHRDNWEGSEDEGTLKTDQEELADALAAIAKYKEAQNAYR